MFRIYSKVFIAFFELYMAGEKYGFAIEVQGKQHEQHIKYFHKSEEDFEKQLMRDQIKKELCEENGIALSLISTDLFYAWYQNKSNERLLKKTIEKGTRPKIDVADDEFVPRPLVVNRLKRILQPGIKQASYHVVCGEHGTGKTILTRIASREVGQGVIYVEIPSDPSDPSKINIEDFGDAFGESLNFKFEEHISFTAQLMKKILGGNGKVDMGPKWKRALKAFKNAGAVYKAKYNKLPVIVYDNISGLIDVNPKILDALQNDAKMNADHRKYIAVFVSSEERSAISRAEEPIEIGDLTREESLDYLVNKRGVKTVSKDNKIDTTEAERLYELVGGRIVDLQSVAKKFLEGQNFEDIKKKQFIKAEEKLRTAKLLKGDEYYEVGKRVIKALLDLKELSRIAYEEFFKNRDEANKVLGLNVFAYHPEKNTVTFQSQLIESYVRENANTYLD
ncbi:P-loop containing nucleoside triphosphate hydrolase protein [Rhizophagus diaphanus]|nr:P-loop containing nucleoside triphosphate hydrolase protein [Rhizophagus diaphanus] [Rhizophagus sp. MUCL 43196]